LRQDDFDGLYVIARDPLIWKQHPDSDRYQVDLFRGFFDGGMESGGVFYDYRRQERHSDRLIALYRI
jgi:hypothetical protein